MKKGGLGREVFFKSYSLMLFEMFGILVPDAKEKILGVI